MSRQFRFLNKSKEPTSEAKFLFVLFSLIVFLCTAYAIHKYAEQIKGMGDPKCFTPLEKWPVRGPDCESK